MNIVARSKKPRSALGFACQKDQCIIRKLPRNNLLFVCGKREPGEQMRLEP
jgi:hypothetical protein